MAVWVVGEDRTEDVPVSALRLNDVVVVLGLPYLPMVSSFPAGVKESMITGESQRVDQTDGAEVLGGTVNGQGSLRVRVLQTGQDTALVGVVRLVSQAQTSPSRTQTGRPTCSPRRRRC